MSPRFNWTCSVLGLLLIFAPQVFGERRGFEHVATTPRTFSTPEQALFGTCTSEDCVLGPAQGRSYFLSDSFEQVDSGSTTTTHSSQRQERTCVVPVPEHESKDDMKASQVTNHSNQGGFGRPSFVRPR